MPRQIALCVDAPVTTANEVAGAFNASIAFAPSAAFESVDDFTHFVGLGTFIACGVNRSNCEPVRVADR